MTEVSLSVNDVIDPDRYVIPGKQFLRVTFGCLHPETSPMITAGAKINYQFCFLHSDIAKSKKGIQVVGGKRAR